MSETFSVAWFLAAIVTHWWWKNIFFCIYNAQAQQTSSKIHSPGLDDIIDSGIGLSYRPGSLCVLCSLAGRYNNPMPQSTLSTESGIMNLATERRTWVGTAGMLICRPEIHSRQRMDTHMQTRAEIHSRQRMDTHMQTRDTLRESRGILCSLAGRYGYSAELAYS